MNKVKLLFSEKLSRTYAMVLVLIIPVLIISNGLWRISVYQKNLDASLAQKAELATEVIGSAMSQDFNDLTLVQTKIDQLKTSNASIDEIVIIMPTQTDFPIVAATNQDKIGISLTDSDFIKIWTQDKIITSSTKNKDSKKSEKYYLSSKTIHDINGEKIAILSVKINDSEISALGQATINQSLIFLVITVFLIFLLLINYFRFFEYFIKFRKIQEVDRMKDEFISMVSHEVKTPLATLKGYLDMLLQGLTGKYDQTTKEHLVKIFANVQRLDILVSELLDVSRIEQGRMQFDMQPVNINDAIKDVLIEIDDQAKNKGLIIENTVQPQLPPVFVDPDRLHQIFENLIGNAIKYTTKGKISINYTLDKGQIKTSIKDTGIGMSMTDSKRLFERFYRIKNEKTMDISGTGLGLWISMAIAKRMNGNIVFRSQENVGSEFTLVLPFIKDKKS